MSRERILSSRTTYRNIGRETAHILGIFPSDELTVTFEKPLEPFDTNVRSIGPDAEMEYPSAHAFIPSDRISTDAHRPR